MDKSTIFSRLQAQKSDHLDPLSFDSRIIRDPKRTRQPPTHFPRPFLNLKIEIVNDSKKCQFKNTDSDKTCETWAKKPVCPGALSPDQGCFVDFGSPLGPQDSSAAGSSPAFLDVKSGAGVDNDIDSIISLSPLSSAADREEGGQGEGRDEGNFSLFYAKGSASERLTSKDEIIEGSYDEWGIGAPLLESSTWVGDEPLGNAEAEVGDPDHGGQTTLSGEDTRDTIDEASLPLQVQGKSVVVVGSSEAAAAAAAPPQPEQSRTSEPKTSGRPEVFGGEENWEREKRLYVCSVSRHINEKPAAGQDVMTELQSLMTHVAERTRRSGGNGWQHPADLTRRNHQRRFGYAAPKLSLREWQVQNGKGHKRFASVPKVFQRSPFP